METLCCRSALHGSFNSHAGPNPTSRIHGLVRIAASPSSSSNPTRSASSLPCRPNPILVAWLSSRRIPHHGDH